jgi:hypothetical protein
LQIIREFQTVKNNQITVDLPEYFNTKEVEIIILPVESKKEKFREFLLHGPVLSEEEISRYRRNKRMVETMADLKLLNYKSF